MLFNSVDFLIFLPIVLVVYFILPTKIRYIWLLITSYYFYMCWNPRYIVLLLFSTIVTYLSGLLIDIVKQKRWDENKKIRVKKVCVASSVFLNFLLLFYFKYFDFTLRNLNVILNKFNLQTISPQVDIILPVGISFYIFQALSYTMDVYREEVNAEKNFLRYALFVSFFPQLVAGPIERTSNLLKQIKKPTYFKVFDVRNGLLIMAYGLFLKVVVANNISGLIDPIYQDYANYNGMQLMVCTILFAFQIYCDFEGYSQMAIGCAQIFGFQINHNFSTPYMAVTIKDFWARWHISLTSWFRDYLYIPLGGNRKGKARKWINTLIVFLASGLWHGAAWHYVVWGGCNGLFLVLHDATENFRCKVNKFMKINTASLVWKFLAGFFTFILVDITWLFFRAQNVKSAISILYQIKTDFWIPYLGTDDFFSMFGSIQTFGVICFSLLIVFCIDVFRYNRINIKEYILKQQLVLRWIIYLMIFLIIIIFGAYGEGYEQTQFIYFQF